MKFGFIVIDAKSFCSKIVFRCAGCGRSLAAFVQARVTKARRLLATCIGHDVSGQGITIDLLKIEQWIDGNGHVVHNNGTRTPTFQLAILSRNFLSDGHRKTRSIECILFVGDCWGQ